MQSFLPPQYSYATETFTPALFKCTQIQEENKESMKTKNCHLDFQICKVVSIYKTLRK